MLPQPLVRSLFRVGDLSRASLSFVGTDWCSGSSATAQPERSGSGRERGLFPTDEIAEAGATLGLLSYCSRAFSHWEDFTPIG